jgi:cysteine desulfurase
MILSSSPSSSLRAAAAASGPLLPTIATTAVLAMGAVLLYRQRCNQKKSASFSMKDFESLLLQEEEASKGDADCIYLDYNGTTPIHALVLAAMLPFLTVHFGNPSSSHAFGLEPQLAITQARQSLLKLVGRESDPTSSIWFTGCGTESDNLAIQLALQSTPPSKRHVVTTNVEHPAVAQCLKALEDDGVITVTYVPVQPQVGTILAQDVIDAIRDDETMLVTIMLANNESGALFPVQDIAAECRKRNILMHTDAAQACGKVDVAQLVGDADLITLVGHKIGAPKGVAALYVRPDCGISNISHNRGIMLLGGGQEGGRRGGTENVPYIVGMGKAADMAVDNLKTNKVHMEGLRTRLLERLTEEIGEGEPIRPNGPTDPSQRLPNTLSIGIPGIVSGALLNKIGHQVAASAGAACHSASSAEGSKISSILQAMQIPPAYARGTLRLSVGPCTTMKDVDRAAHLIARQVKLEREAMVNTI